MKNKKIRLFVAFFIGIIFLAVYILFIYAVYISVSTKEGKFLAWFVPIPFILGILSVYISLSQLAKKIFISGTFLFTAFAFFVPFSGDLLREIFIRYSRLETEKQEHKFVSLADTIKVLDNKNFSLLSPKEGFKVRQCLLNERNELLLLYAYTNNNNNPFYSPDGYFYGKDIRHSPYISVFDSIGNIKYDIDLSFLYTSQEADYIIKGNYIIDIYNYEYIDYRLLQYITQQPMIFLENYDPSDKEDTRRSPITYYRITSDGKNNFENDGKIMGIFIKDREAYYFFPPDDGTNYQDEKDETLSMNYLLSTIKDQEEEGKHSLEHKNILPKDFYYEYLSMNGLFRDKEYNSYQIKWAKINLMFNLVVENDTLPFKKTIETKYNKYNQLKTPSFYIENETETLEKYKDMIFYTNKNLSYSIFYDGDNIYMIQKEKKEIKK
ncbi:MAG: hypothetical protein Q3983_10150 [Capnocytophaga sp.]|nr:hypothetical protein [Capnocytophaga sp.]